MAKFSSHSGTTTRQARSRAVSSVWPRGVSGRPAANSPLGVPSALPRRAPSGQLLTILPAVHLVQEQSGDKMETRKIGKAAIKRPTHRCQTVYAESPGGPSENSLIRKSTISRGKDVWMYETSLVLLYVFKWKSQLRKPAVSWIVSPPKNKFTKKCWSPNPQNVWMWPHLERVSAGVI